MKWLSCFYSVDVQMTRGSWIRSFAVFGGANFEDQAREIEVCLYLDHFPLNLSDPLTCCSVYNVLRFRIMAISALFSDDSGSEIPS